MGTDGTAVGALLQMSILLTIECLVTLTIACVAVAIMIIESIVPIAARLMAIRMELTRIEVLSIVRRL